MEHDVDGLIRLRRTTAALLLGGIVLLAGFGCDALGSAVAESSLQPEPEAAAEAPPGAFTPDALANATYPSMLLEGAAVKLTDGRFHEPGRGITFTLLPEPVGHGVIDGVPVAAVLLAESGGGSGTFVSLVLVGQVAGQPVGLATASLGDRPRVKHVAIRDDGTVTVQMVQVGAQDRFCCPATPMSVDYVYADGQLAARRVSSATIDVEGYADQANAFILQPTPYDRSEPPGGQGEPGHFAWTFGTDVDLDLARAQVSGTGYVAVYPVSPYRAIWEAAGDPFVADTLEALDSLLAKRPAEPRAPLPGLPLRNAVNDFAAQVAYLDLPDGGRGVRFVGRFAQDAAPLRNDQLRYVFQGLSADGSWLVIASLPISTTALPQDNEVAVVDPGAPHRDITVHLEQWRRTFNDLRATDFEPSLDVLDRLLRSVTVSTTDLIESR